MCVTFLALATQSAPIGGKYRLILVNNRDEQFDRPTSRLKLCWDDHILAGWDESADERGTWLGVDGLGRLAVLLSVTEPKSKLRRDAPSRGVLAKQFLSGSLSARHFLTNLAPKAPSFNGFHLLVMDSLSPAASSFEFNSLCNRFEQMGPMHWPDGVHAFGNSSRRECPFRKMEYGETLFRRQIEHSGADEHQLVEALFRMAADRTFQFPDEQLRLQFGCPEDSDAYKRLTALFVDGSPEGIAYGTRSTSVVLVDAEGNVSFHEKAMDDELGRRDRAEWTVRTERFRIGNDH